LVLLRTDDGSDDDFTASITAGAVDAAPRHCLDVAVRVLSATRQLGVLWIIMMLRVMRCVM
jgi:hypothetical protein